MKSGMKVSLSAEKTRVNKAPRLVAFGHFVSPARIRPTKSLKLKTKKPPTKRKYFAQVEFSSSMLTVSPKRLGKTLRARRKCQVVFNTSTKSENSTFSRVSLKKCYQARK